MNLETARTFAYATDWTMADFVKAYNLLADSTVEGDSAWAQDLSDGIPYLFSYDENGNWIGEISGENGWTA